MVLLLLRPPPSLLQTSTSTTAPDSRPSLLLLGLRPRAAGDCVLRALEREPEAEGELLLLRQRATCLGIVLG